MTMRGSQAAGLATTSKLIQSAQDRLKDFIHGS